jgi:hypothetical protein
MSLISLTILLDYHAFASLSITFQTQTTQNNHQKEPKIIENPGKVATLELRYIYCVIKL